MGKQHKIWFQIDGFTSFTVSDLFGNTILPYFPIFYIWKILEIKVIEVIFTPHDCYYFHIISIQKLSDIIPISLLRILPISNFKH